MNWIVSKGVDEIEWDEDENEIENVTKILRDIVKMKSMKKELQVKRRKVKGKDEIQRRRRDVENETLEREENDDLIEKIDFHHVLRT